jgi:hypothetical protein
MSPSRLRDNSGFYAAFYSPAPTLHLSTGQYSTASLTCTVKRQCLAPCQISGASSLPSNTCESRAAQHVYVGPWKTSSQMFVARGHDHNFMALARPWLATVLWRPALHCSIAGMIVIELLSISNRWPCNQYSVLLPHYSVLSIGLTPTPTGS